MNNIGAWAVIFEKLELDAYLARNPPAILLQSSETGSYKVSDTNPGMTLFRMEPDEQLTKTLFSEDSGEAKARAYYVLPLGPAERPAGPQRYLIGCTDAADMQVDDASVSREHAWLERNGETYILEDAGSTLGTKVEGKRLLEGHRRELTSGETVTLGEVEMTFLEPMAFYKFVKFFMESG